MGVVDLHAPMISSFAAVMAEAKELIKGNISMVSQSGALISTAQGLAAELNYGFRYTASTGNEATVTAADFFNAFAGDDKTKVILSYLEGVRDADKFRASLREARQARVPIVMMKSGKTATSALAAQAHTGALAGEGRVWDAVMDEEAVIQANSLEEQMDIALYLSGANLDILPWNRDVTVISIGGGSGVLAADQCERLGLKVPPLSDAVRAKLKELVTPLASTRNPIDLTPTTLADPKWFELFPKALDVIAEDRDTGAIFFQLGPMSNDKTVSKVIADFHARSPKMLFVSWPLPSPTARDTLRLAGNHAFSDANRALNVISKLADYRATLDASGGVRTLSATQAKLAAFDWAKEVPNAKAGTVISEHECHRILAKAGVPVAKGRLAASAADAVNAAQEAGYPVVMKGISPAITHRAAAGLVALNIASDADVTKTDALLRERAAAKGATLEGVYVQHMVSGGTELLVSAIRDPVFGVMISVGAGGVLTELLDDVALASAPVDLDAAKALLSKLRIVAKMKSKPSDKAFAAMAAFIADFSALAAACPWQRFAFELNPVKWTDDAAVAVDGLIVISEA
jgi:acetyltransferase